MAIVYQHRRNDTGQIFYIGIGTSESRAYQKSKGDRSVFWHKTVAKAGGRTVEIVHEAEMSECKYTEKYLIAYYGRRDKKLGMLVNLTDGGEGDSGYVMSDKRKQEVSEFFTGRAPWHKDKKMPQWIKDKYSKADRSKSETPIRMYTLEGDFIHTFTSSKQAAAELGIDGSALGKVLRGKRIKCGGFTFRYADEEWELRTPKKSTYKPTKEHREALSKRMMGNTLGAKN